MYLIYEQDNLPVAVDNLLYHAFQPFLELSLVFCTGNQCPQVQRIDLLCLEVLRNVAVHDVLRDTFRNSGFPDSRLPDQDRIVLRPPAQDLEDTPDLLIPADDRVQLALRRPLVQVDGEFFKKFKFIVFHMSSPPFKQDGPADLSGLDAGDSPDTYKKQSPAPVSRRLHTVKIYSIRRKTDILS